MLGSCPSVHKDVRSQGGRGFVQFGHIYRQEGGDSSDADIRTFWYKPSNFSKFIVCPHGKEVMGFEPMQTRGKRGQFLRYCADVFYGRPLMHLRAYMQL